MSLFSRKRSLLQSQKLLRRERAWKWTKLIFVVALFGGLLCGLSALSCSPKLTVQNILVTGNSVVPTDEVLAIARDEMNGRNLLLFSRANILWYPKQQIIDTLQHSYSWIDTVSIDRVNATTISIKIKERVPVAVWCGADRDKPVSCQLMDAQGYAFAKAPEFSGAAYLKLYGPVAPASWRGAEFSSQQGLAHMLGLVKGLSEIGFQPLEIAVASTDTSTNAYDVFLSSGTRISVKTSDSVSVIISNISLLLMQKAFADSQTSNFSNLLYIDARFGNKLFYKFK